MGLIVMETGKYIMINIQKRLRLSVLGCLNLTYALRMALLDQSGISIQGMGHTEKPARLVTKVQESRKQALIGIQYQEARSHCQKTQKVEGMHQQVKLRGELFWKITYTSSGYYGCIANDPQIQCLWTKTILILLMNLQFFVDFTYSFPRERAQAGVEARGEGERESPADCTEQRAHVELDPMIQRSRPKLNQKVGHSPN